MSKYELLTDEQWQWIEPLIPSPPAREDACGHQVQHDDRAIMNGVLWVLRTGACWAHLPKRFPSGSSCYRRFSRWLKAGTMRKVLEMLARHLEERGGLDLSECFMDGTFIVAKKGEPKWERPSGAKVRSSWRLQTLLVFHSQCTRILLAHMKSPLCKLHWIKLTPWDDIEELWGIVPTTVIRSIESWLNKVSN